MIDIERIAPDAHQFLVYGEISRDDIAAFIAFAKAQVETGERSHALFDKTMIAIMPTLPAIPVEVDIRGKSM